MYVDLPKFFPGAIYPPFIHISVSVSLLDSSGGILGSKTSKYDLVHTDQPCSSTLQIGPGKPGIKSLVFLILTSGSCY